MSSFGNGTNLQWHKIIAQKDEEIDVLKEEILTLKSLLKFEEYDNNIPCLRLSNREQLTLNLLLKNPDSIVTYERIYSVWDAVEGYEENQTKVVIYQIRKKLKKHDLYIRNIWGVGYKVTKDMVSKFKILHSIHKNCTHECQVGGQ